MSATHTWLAGLKHRLVPAVLPLQPLSVELLKAISRLDRPGNTSNDDDDDDDEDRVQELFNGTQGCALKSHVTQPKPRCLNELHTDLEAFVQGVCNCRFFYIPASSLPKL